LCFQAQPASPLAIHILAAVAEHEREAISERTKAALAAAKARGNEVGHPEADARGPYGECGTVCGQRPADHSRD
jgi:DNA invertase Pin-like site-specific DNA recombinase